MVNSSAVGERGEAIFFLALTELVGSGVTPYFRAIQQGEKWPVTDFYCELADQTGYAFLVQAKATRKPVSKRKKLSIAKLSKTRVQKLFNSPYPFYLVAVDEPNKSAYIGVPTTCRAIGSLPTSHLLSTKATLDMLKKEIEDFWSQSPIIKFDPTKSIFSF